MTVLISFVRHRFRARVARFSRNDRDHFVELSDVNENFQFCRKVPKANYLFLATYVFQLIVLVLLLILLVLVLLLLLLQQQLLLLLLLLAIST